MAEFYSAKEIGKKIEETLNICKWESINNGERFEIELPIHTYFNYQRVKLYILPVDDGYYIHDDGEAFLEYSFDADYYYDLFKKNNSDQSYDISVYENHFYKKYHFDFSVIAALDEFIRFFIYLDDFMLKNDL